MPRESISRPEDRISEVEKKFPLWRLVGIFVLASFIYHILKILINLRFSMSFNHFFEIFIYHSIDLVILAITSITTYSMAKYYKRISLPNMFMRCLIFVITYIFCTNIFGVFMKMVNPYLFFDYYQTTIGCIPTALQTSFLFVLIWLTLEHKTTTKQ